MASILSWYNSKLSSNPLIVNVVSTAALFGIGDAVAQSLDTTPTTVTPSDLKPTGNRYDYGRTARAAAYGGIVFAPIVTKWYPIINKIVDKRPAIQTAKRVAADQLFFAPFLGVPLYFTCIGAMEGKSAAEIKQSLEEKYPSTLITNWKVWPAVQFANFWVVPLQYRLLVVNVVSIAWNTYLSQKNAST